MAKIGCVAARAWPENTLPGSGVSDMPPTHVRRNLFHAWRWSELADSPQIRCMLEELKEERGLEVCQGGMWMASSNSRRDKSTSPYRIKPGVEMPDGFSEDIWVRMQLAGVPLVDDEWPPGELPMLPELKTNKNKGENVDPIKLTTVQYADGIDISTITVGMEHDMVLPRQARIEQLLAHNAAIVAAGGTPSKAALREIDALQKSIIAFTDAMNAREEGKE